jgi:hypothetical protein
MVSKNKMCIPSPKGCKYKKDGSNAIEFVKLTLCFSPVVLTPSRTKRNKTAIVISILPTMPIAQNSFTIWMGGGGGTFGNYISAVDRASAV